MVKEKLNTIMMTKTIKYSNYTVQKQKSVKYHRNAQFINRSNSQIS